MTIPSYQLKILKDIHPIKIDGLFHGKPYEQMDDLGFFPYFWKLPFSL